MMMYIVVPGLIVVVILVVVLVALGLRANRAGAGEDDWMAEEQPQRPRGRRAAPPPMEEPASVEGGYAEAYQNGYDDGYDNPGYDPGYDNAGYENAAAGGAYDRRVAGGPLAAPTGPPAPPAPSGPPAPPPPLAEADEEMGDDDYWATITFDKPKFPWQHDRKEERSEADLANDPLGSAAETTADGSGPQIPPIPAEPAAPGMTQPVSLNGGDGYGDGQYDNQQYDNQQYDGGQYDTQYDGQYGSEPYSPEPAYGGQQDGYGSALPEPGYSSEPAYDGYASGPQEPAYGNEPSVPGGYGTGPQPEPAAAQYGTGPQSFPSAPEPHDLPVASQFRADSPGDILGGNPAGPTRQDPLDFPTPPPSSDPLGLPVSRADDRASGGSFTAPAEPTYGSPAETVSSFGTDTPLAGAGPLHGGFGDRPAPRTDPSGIPGLGSLPPAASTGASSASGATAGRQNDTDGHRLPTVDELLQRIQSERAGSSSSGGGPSAGSLTDPLNDPLSTTHDPSYGSGTPWSSPPASAGSSGMSGAGRGHTDDLSGGQLSGSGLSGGFSGLGGTSSNGSNGSGGYGSGSSSGGYPSTPAYGDAPRYDDPLSAPPAGRDAYGSFGSTGENPLPGSVGAPESGSGRYGDFSGSSYGSSGDPTATQAFGNGYFGGSQQQSGYGQQNTGETSFVTPPESASPDQAQTQPYGQQDQRPNDDWEHHRDYRR